MTKRNTTSASSQSEENVPQYDPAELQAALEQFKPACIAGINRLDIVVNAIKTQI